MSIGFGGFGYEYGGGLKIMATDELGFFSEVMFENNKLGRDKHKMDAILVNIGIFTGVLK